MSIIKVFDNIKISTKAVMSQSSLGFTLAEVLITLGIIGIVAAMTIPTLLHEYKIKRTISILKEDQSIITQMLKLSEVENGEPEGWDGVGEYSEENSIKVSKKINPYLKIATDCGTYDPKGMCVRNATYRHLNGAIYSNYALNRGMYKVKLLNGSTIMYYTYPSLIIFVVDVNGNKLPNTIGIDVFYFKYNVGSGLVANGQPNFYDYKTHCTKDSDGWGCTYYVLNFGNMDYLKK